MERRVRTHSVSESFCFLFFFYCVAVWLRKWVFPPHSAWVLYPVHTHVRHVLQSGVAAAGLFGGKPGGTVAMPAPPPPRYPTEASWKICWKHVFAPNLVLCGYFSQRCQPAWREHTHAHTHMSAHTHTLMAHVAERKGKSQGRFQPQGVI